MFFSSKSTDLEVDQTPIHLNISERAHFLSNINISSSNIRISGFTTENTTDVLFPVSAPQPYFPSVVER